MEIRRRDVHRVDFEDGELFKLYTMICSVNNAMTHAETALKASNISGDPKVIEALVSIENVDKERTRLRSFLSEINDNLDQE